MQQKRMQQKFKKGSFDCVEGSYECKQGSFEFVYKNTYGVTSHFLRPTYIFRSLTKPKM